MNHLTELSQIMIGELGRTTEIKLAWFKDSKLSGFILLKEKISKFVIYDQARVNVGSNWATLGSQATYKNRIWVFLQDVSDPTGNTIVLFLTILLKQILMVIYRVSHETWKLVNS